MSYSSRVYRQRNAHSHEEPTKKDAFFKRQKSAENKISHGGFFQAKSAKNEVSDPFEKEADAVANKIVDSKTDNVVVQQKDITNIQRSAEEKQELQQATERKKEEIQKQAEDEAELEKEEGIQKKGELKEEEKKVAQKKEIEKEKEKKPIQQKPEMSKEDEEKVQRKNDPLKEEEKSAMQPKLQSSDQPISGVLFQRLNQPYGTGAPLSVKVLKEMNTTFAADFSKVRIHADKEAAEMNQALQAQAFALGKDIYFNHGKYNPDSSEGKRLLAHELTHTIQQTGKDHENTGTSNFHREEEEKLRLKELNKQVDEK